MMNSVTRAQNLLPPPSFIPQGTYVGIFGGWGHSGNNSVTQTGTAFFPPEQGGPLDIHATGDVGGSSGIAGLQVGYLWPCWKCITPGVELEGYYLRTTQTGELDNPGTRLPEHTFDVSFPMNTGVFLVNGILTTTSPCTNVSPYIGVGVGAAVVSISGADSFQRRPFEPGVNHFNGSPHANGWMFAAQGKAGLRFNFVENLQLITEYRLLYVASKSYTFGSTQYPNHVPTTKFNVNFNRMFHNLAVVGLQYSFC